MRYLQIPVFLGALLVGFTAMAQEAPHPVNPVLDPNLSINLPMQKIGPDDLLGLNVYDSPEFTRTVRVASDGTVRLPMLKTLVHVEGLFPSEAETAIGEALKSEQLLVDPFVTVTVAEYHSHPVNVMGAVKYPLIFQAVGNVTLVDALAKAGGLDLANAGSEVVVTRPGVGSAPDSVTRVPVKPLLSGQDPSLNMKLTGGETITVPQVTSIIVEGSVIKPGVYPVQDPISLNTVSTAIAQAGGLAQFCDHKAFIYRLDDAGVRHTIEVPLWDILNRKKPDVMLQARDILHVPDSPRRRVVQTTIQTMSGTASAATSAVILVAR